MSFNDKIQELEFHFDRVQESALRLTRSVAENPRIPHEERFFLLQQIAQRYMAVGQLIQQSLNIGVDQGLTELKDAQESGSVAELLEQKAQQVSTEGEILN